jgi:hypothetical protein
MFETLPVGIVDRVVIGSGKSSLAPDLLQTRMGKLVGLDLVRRHVNVSLVVATPVGKVIHLITELVFGGQDLARGGISLLDTKVVRNGGVTREGWPGCHMISTSFVCLITPIMIDHDSKIMQRKRMHPNIHSKQKSPSSDSA